jgi:putative endonuclease
MFGNRGEEIAEAHYARLGYRLLARNFRTKRGEADRIFLGRDGLLFVEVKARRGDWEEQAWEPHWRIKALRMRGVMRVFLAAHPEHEGAGMRWEIAYVTQGRVTATFPGI